MSLDIKKFTADELTPEKVDGLISRNDSFQVVSVGNISSVVSKIEGRIEKMGLKCRVYTEYRSATMAATFSPAALVGLGSALAIGVHNLATFNPDYEIGKNKVAGTVTVLYKK